jgi:GT2 family glycosyltransferase
MSRISNVTISAIIPSLAGNTARLEEALAHQTRPPDEVKVIRGVSPNGAARNLGAKNTAGDILLFIDDDAIPGSPKLIESLIKPLLEDPTIGVTGAARVLPPDASWFQKRVAAEIPRTVNHIPNSPLETNPPLNGYGHSLITTTCCALRRMTYTQAGGFSERLTSGVDTEFFYRLRCFGLRFLMVPHVFVEHRAPENLPALLRKFRWYGMGYAQEAQQRPERRIGPRLPTVLHQAAFLLMATLWVIPNIIVLYSYGYPHFELGFRPLKALSTYAVAWGYADGWRGREN